jgi:hypothetical protein
MPMTAAPLGAARMKAPHLQLSRAILPDQRIWVMVAPGGALKACPE